MPRRAPAPTLTNQFVEILCDNYELRTNLAVFRQDVRVSDRLGEQLQRGNDLQPDDTHACRHK